MGDIRYIQGLILLAQGLLWDFLEDDEVTLCEDCRKRLDQADYYLNVLDALLDPVEDC